VWFAHTRLGAWEQLTQRMRAGWPPDGWYPVDYFREDLRTRDELAAVALPEGLSDRFAEALERVDEAFRAGTREVGGTGDWWWRRVPDPEPWERQP
jgi:ribosomal protein S18 acetylase RimI-like enzyme